MNSVSRVFRKLEALPLEFYPFAVATLLQTQGAEISPRRWRPKAVQIPSTVLDVIEDFEELSSLDRNSLINRIDPLETAKSPKSEEERAILRINDTELSTPQILTLAGGICSKQIKGGTFQAADILGLLDQINFGEKPSVSDSLKKMSAVKDDAKVTIVDEKDAPVYRLTDSGWQSFNALLSYERREL